MSREEMLVEAGCTLLEAAAYVRLIEDPPCECHLAGDTFDPRGCPAHDPEVQPWA